ncbi:AI-2E family transporter [Paenibacillus sp. MY03]|jgi:predicted PurR-regulated permease PerM|uniref:AI-2E family transporter n=1 Tax=Paenibacillus agaridevorans TaxID=171404 RepID=A0A2R5ERM5_9BACL|nr:MULTISPECIES: AI-2E family transporter [Paenibacillus]OUS77925.1 AI-2E family transporter [Paenibacillus sp. MY03]GBG08785.1 AI-2E family transporter [Paenibacillus agaridevorans]
MTKLNVFIRICIAVLLVLGIIYLSSLVSFIFTPLLSLFSIILTPLLLSGFFYYLMRPLIDYLEGKKLNRSLAILLLYLVISLLLAVFFIGVWPSLKSQVMNLVHNAPAIFAGINEQLEKLSDNEFIAPLLPANTDISGQVTELLNKGFNVVSSSVSGLFTFFSDFAIVLITFPIMLFYMLKEGGKFKNRLVWFFPSRYKEDGRSMLGDIDQALSNFIVGRVIVNLALGVLMYIGFLIIGLPYALLLTVVAVILNFFPVIGAILSSIPIVIIGLIVSPATAIWSLVIILAAQQVQDNLIAPYVFGKKLDIHPLTTIILVLVGGDIAGIVGFLLVIPIYMIVKIVGVKSYELYIRTRKNREETPPPA